MRAQNLHTRRGAFLGTSARESQAPLRLSFCGPRCNDQQMTLRSVRPLGTFHARQTRDSVARARDGQTFVLMNELPNMDGSTSIEIMFEDGVWMLAESPI